MLAENFFPYIDSHPREDLYHGAVVYQGSKDTSSSFTKSFKDMNTLGIHFAFMKRNFYAFEEEYRIAYMIQPFSAFMFPNLFRFPLAKFVPLGGLDDGNKVPFHIKPLIEKVEVFSRTPLETQLRVEEILREVGIKLQVSTLPFKEQRNI